MAKTDNKKTVRPYRNAKTGEHAAVTFPGTGKVLVTRANGRTTIIKIEHFMRPSSPWKGTRAADAVALAAFVADPNAGVSTLTIVAESAANVARVMGSISAKADVTLAAARS